MKKVTPAKSQDKQIRGRPIPSGYVITHRAAGVSVRPLKLAFLINEATPKDQFLRICYG